MSYEMNCSLARALSEVGERWTLLIVREAIMGSHRFDHFHQRLGIARNILTDRLAKLVAHNVLTKTPSAENARLYDYRLTEKGRDLIGAMAALLHWGDKWLDQGQGPPVLLLDRKTNAPLPRVTLNRKSGSPVMAEDIVIVAGPGASQRTQMRLKGISMPTTGKPHPI